MYFTNFIASVVNGTCFYFIVKRIFLILKGTIYIFQSLIQLTVDNLKKLKYLLSLNLKPVQVKYRKQESAII